MKVRLQGETAQVRRWYGWQTARDWYHEGIHGLTIELANGREVYLNERAMSKFQAGNEAHGELKYDTVRRSRFPMVEAMFGLWCALIGMVIAGLSGWPLPIGIIGGCIGMYVLFFMTMGVEMHILRYILLLLIILGGTFAIGGLIGGVAGAKAAIFVVGATLVVFVVALALLIVSAFFWDWFWKRGWAKPG